MEIELSRLLIDPLSARPMDKEQFMGDIDKKVGRRMIMSLRSCIVDCTWQAR